MRINQFHVVLLLVLVFTIAVAAAGLFSTANPTPHFVVNQYGDAVKLYGSGLYAHDSFFRAPIFRGTDFTMLFVACPLLAIAMFYDLKQHTRKTRLLLVSLTGVFVYYAVSISFGVSYNRLHLVYILLFSTSCFALIIGVRQSVNRKLLQTINTDLPYKGIGVFLVLTGIALLGAWLPPIMASLLTKRPPALIEIYTTEVTNVLDLGVIVPLCFFCLFQLRRRTALGYVLLDLLLTLCAIIGVMLPVQTAYQVMAGIELPTGDLLTKVASFCLLAAFAAYFKLRLYHVAERTVQTKRQTADDLSHFI